MQSESSGSPNAIVEALEGQSQGLSFGEIYSQIGLSASRRTVQYWLKDLVENGRLRTTGRGRWVRYQLNEAVTSTNSVETNDQTIITLSPDAIAAQKYIRQSQASRTPVGYDRQFLESYHPNQSRYLCAEERRHLATVGEPGVVTADAGTYAKQILSRLLIDLAWNSSRLEGNTYSLGDAKRLLAFGQAAEDQPLHDTQMILNHRDAIEFLVNSADEIDLNPRTIQNLHGLLANNLLSEPVAEGRLRYIPVGIGSSVFHPLEDPHQIRECFEQVLTTAAAIDDPFEQAFFLMVQLPYLQPFDDVNKRVSRLAANIPFIKRNLSPLSFTEVPTDLYREAILAIYELRDIALLKDVFLWAYERSARRYRAVRQSLGEPDPLKLRYRVPLRVVITRIIQGRVGPQSALELIRQLARQEIPETDRDAFISLVETELTSLHDGNFARYSVRPSEFDAWKAIWTSN